MPSPGQNRTTYGGNKYAALHLLLAKWLREFPQQPSYRYVTLGGTELRDLQSLRFIDPKLLGRAISFESEEDRFAIARETANKLGDRGLPIQLVEGDIFDYKRDSDETHLFFVDLEGTCILSNYHVLFANLLSDEVLREGDALLITSYLGRNIGWQKLFNAFNGEIRNLGITDAASKRQWFRRAHPSFTLFRALSEADLQDELAFRCFGCVEYRDRSPMAVYGYCIHAGRTNFVDFIKQTPHFHINRGYLGRDSFALKLEYTN